MALDPEKDPKGFAIFLIAVGLRIFGNQAWTDSDRLHAAEKFVAEAENKLGKF